MKTIGELKDSVGGILQGTNLDTVTNLNGALSRAARVLAQHVDTPEATVTRNYMFFDGVYDYPAYDTIFGTALVDIRPQGVSRQPWETVIKRPISMFDQTKIYLPTGYEATFEWNLGVPKMRVAQKRANQSLLLDNMGDANSWTAGGSITTLYDDTATYYESPGSIRFNLPSTGTITKTLSNTLDLSTYEGVGSVFLALWLPSTDLTSVTLRIGSNSSNYTEITATTGFIGAFQANNFQLVQFDLANGTTTGTPDYDNIDYLYVSLTPGSAMTNVRVGNLFIAQPSAHEVIYQTAAIFLSSGVMSNTISSEDDQIVLNDAAYTIYEYMCAQEIAIQSGGLVSQIVIDRIKNTLFDDKVGLIPKYRADNPSQELRLIGSYYDGANY